MTTPDTAAGNLKRLRKLLADYSHHERRTSVLLAEIDERLGQALRETIRLGARPHEVEAAIGPPQKIAGERSAPSFRWLYPSLCSPDEAARTPEWFFSLRFEKGKLRTIAREGWSD